MRKLISSALVVLMLVMTGVGSFAATQQPIRQAAVKTTMATGQIALIKGRTLTIKDQAGKERTYRLGDPAMLKGYKAGERVTLALENGKVTSIKKFEVAMPTEHSTGSK
jgi:hypothetical protein